MTRSDLLALTPESLIALTNRGLLKRATKDVDSGAGPTVTIDPNGAVSGDYPDGVRVVLPLGASVDTATCTCPATGVCRHALSLVLAYQRQVSAAPDVTDESASEGDSTTPPPVVDWSPGAFTDEDLAEFVGSRALATARRTLRAGFTANVRRPTNEDPVPRVELAACTVRFLVPNELSYVHTDATASVRDRVIPLAIWAFRAADEQDRSASELLIDVGGNRATGVTGSGVEPALALTEDILLDGVVHSGPTLAATIARVRRDVDTAGYRWPLLALDDLDDQLSAYRERSARYQADTVAYLVAELHARHRAVTNSTQEATSPRSRVLGTEEAASTPLKRLRLIGLGCRVSSGIVGVGSDRGAHERVVQVYFAHPDTQTVFVLRRSWKADGDNALTGYDLSGTRVSGVRLSLLASGEVVSESASRSASRTVRLSTSRVAKTTVAPFNDSWSGLPEDLLIQDFARSRRTMEELPPRLIRPRVEAEFVKAVSIGTVCSVGYLPGDQRLDAVIEDTDGERARISATYRGVCPGALDALAEALNGTHGRPRYVSGTLHRTRGGIVIDPLAVVVDDKIIVIDLAEGDGGGIIDTAIDKEPQGPIEDAVAAALSLLAEGVHTGLRHLPPTFVTRLIVCSDTLTQLGLSATGACMRTLADTVGPDPDSAAVAAWVNAQIRLSVIDEHV